MARTLLVALLGVAACLVENSVSAEPEQVLPERFQRRAVAVYVMDRRELCTLKDVRLHTIGGRVFLVGRRHVSTPDEEGAGDDIAVALDRVVALKAFGETAGQKHRQQTQEGTPAAPSKQVEKPTDSFPLKNRVETWLRRAKDIDAEIQLTLRLIAKEEVKLKELSRTSETVKARVKDLRQSIEQLQRDLARRETSYSYHGQTYSPQQVQDDVAERHRRLHETLSDIDANGRELRQHQQQLKEAQQQLEDLKNLRDAKRQLEGYAQHKYGLTKTSRWKTLQSEASRIKDELRALEAAAHASGP